MRNTIMVFFVVGLLFLSGCAANQGDKVTVTPPSDSGVGMANPAAVFCEEQGGSLNIVTDSDGGQRGLCTLQDGTVCDEWAYFRGECGAPAEHVCTEEQKSAEMCTLEYMPVCGDDGVTYGNKCAACASKKVDSWSWGECAADESMCTCPEGYIQEGDACNPACYYSEPRCLMPSISCTATEPDCSGGCPMLSAPGPGFCNEGTVVSGGKNACGCDLPPKCDTGSDDAVTSPGEQVACTMEAKLCPDGSAVGRSGPDCEFAPCPGEDTADSGTVSDTAELEHNICSPESKTVAGCTKEYHPVCGWFNQSIKCFKYPCAIDADNPCIACQNENVEYWTEGECPK